MISKLTNLKALQNSRTVLFLVHEACVYANDHRASIFHGDSSDSQVVVKNKTRCFVIETIQ